MTARPLPVSPGLLITCAVMAAALAMGLRNTFGLVLAATLDWRAAVLTLLALGLIFVFKWGIIRTLALCAAGGLALTAL
ncbi:hypothetical protein J4558_16745 [Leptolyngbya sp. 15MV]|nr:hypothetical protein J4558_16745 [Leptolyngbya sp. 15MV]